VLTTIFCLWFGKLSAEARRQREVVQWILKSGGRVGYDWQDREGKTFPAPGWLRSLLGDEYFQTPTRVRLTHLRGVDLSPLYELTRLEALDLTSNGISDLEPIARFRRLRELTLTDNELTSIEALKQLAELDSLTIDYNAIEDLSPLAASKQLKSLNIEHNRVADIRPLAELPRLRELNLAVNPIRDPAPLFKLVRLVSLRIGRYGFSESQMMEVEAALPNIAIEVATVPPSASDDTSLFP
jgi:hypothetical protein